MESKPLASKISSNLLKLPFMKKAMKKAERVDPSQNESLKVAGTAKEPHDRSARNLLL